MKDFVEAYKEARAKAWEYMGAKRAGWVDPGKRTRENHAILVPRREAVAMADELATAMECRCYHGGEGRTKLHVLKYQRRDYVALAGGVVILALVVVLRRLGT